MVLEVYKISNQAKFDVIDGDTFDIIDGARSARVRLSGIDAPELSQPFGNEATSWLEENLFSPLIKKRAVDQYNRVVAEIINGDGVCLNLELVRLGLAWVHPFYGKKYSDSDALLIAQDRAITKCLGVHRDPNVQPPWEYRSEDNSHWTTIMNRIHHQAKLKGIETYKDLAAECGLSFATSFRYWNDPYAFPSRKILLKLCNGLDVNLSDLLELR